MKQFSVKNFLTALLIIFFFAGCAPTLKSRVLLPAEINLKGYKNVAVVNFEGKEQSGQNISRWLEAGLLKTKIGGKPYFKVVSRGQLNKVIDEHKLGMVGITDPRTTKKLGKILGIDALITGTVDGWDIEDGYHTEERTRYVRVGNQSIPQTYYVDCTMRRAYVGFTTNFIDVETANIEVSESTSHEIKEDVCGGARTTQLSPKSKMLKNCAQVAIAIFVRKISPHYGWVELSLKPKDDSPSSGGGMLAAGIPFFSKVSAEEKAIREKEKATKKRVDEHIKSGCTYAKNGAWDRSLAEFQKAVELKPDSPSANYNIGVLYEIKGKLQKAKEKYEKAVSLKADSVYIKAVSHIEDRIAKQEEVKKQLR